MTHDSKRGSIQAASGMFLVGTLVAVSAALGDYPVYGGQALRYGLGAVALGVVMVITKTRPKRLTGRQWLLLASLSLSGLVLFNVFIVEANRHVSPALIGTIIGASPVVMALVGPLVARSGAPSSRVLGAAAMVTLGTAIAAGLGGGSLTGVLLSVGALAGEVSFSLLAVPLLPALGALRVSAYTAALAVPMLLGIGWFRDGGALLPMPTVEEALTIGYLGLVVTTVAFLLWYDALPRLGPDRAGLFAGVMPIGAVVCAMVLGLGLPSAAEAVGAGCVVLGILYGLRRGRVARTPLKTPVSSLVTSR